MDLHCVNLNKDSDMSMYKKWEMTIYIHKVVQNISTQLVLLLSKSEQIFTFVITGINSSLN